jgi:branched-chain amino acid transport system substrate-binding protein
MAISIYITDRGTSCGNCVKFWTTSFHPANNVDNIIQLGGTMRIPLKALRVCIAGGAVLATTVMATGGVASAKDTAPIVVGGVWSEADYNGAQIGAEAVFNAFNAAGGLDGRKIKFIGMQDDASSPTQDLAATKTLVNDHVMAVLPVMTAAWDGGTVLANAGIPYFGWGIAPSWYGSKNGYSYDGAVAPTPTTNPLWADTGPIVCRAIAGGCKGKTVALLSENNQSAIESMQSFGDQLKLSGAKVVAELSSIPEPPAVVSDYSPYVEQALTSNHGGPPDIVEQLLAPTLDIGVLKTLNAEGFKGTDLNFSLYDPIIVSLAKGGDTLVGQIAYQQTTPAVTKMIAALKATSSTVDLGQPAEAGYITAEMFIDAIKKIGPSVTGPKLIKVLNSGWAYGGDGLTGAETFPAAHTGPGHCSSVVHSNGTVYTVAVPLTCVPITKNPLYKKK